MAQFDIMGAIREGYSPKEIASYLKEQGFQEELATLYKQQNAPKENGRPARALTSQETAAIQQSVNTVPKQDLPLTEALNQAPSVPNRTFPVTDNRIIPTPTDYIPQNDINADNAAVEIPRFAGRAVYSAAGGLTRAVQGGLTLVRDPGLPTPANQTPVIGTLKSAADTLQWMRTGIDPETGQNIGSPLAVSPEQAQRNPIASTVGEVGEGLADFGGKLLVSGGVMPAMGGLSGAAHFAESRDKLLMQNPGMSEQEATARALPGAAVDAAIFSAMPAVTGPVKSFAAQGLSKIPVVGTLSQAANTVSSQIITDTAYMTGQGIAVGMTDKVTGVSPEYDPVQQLTGKNIAMTAGQAALFAMMHAFNQPSMSKERGLSTSTRPSDASGFNKEEISAAFRNADPASYTPERAANLYDGLKQQGFTDGELVRLNPAFRDVFSSRVGAGTGEGQQPTTEPVTEPISVNKPVEPIVPDLSEAKPLTEKVNETVPDNESTSPDLAKLMVRKANLEKSIFNPDGTEKPKATQRMKDNYAAITETINTLTQEGRDVQGIVPKQDAVQKDIIIAPVSADVEGAVLDSRQKPADQQTGTQIVNSEIQESGGQAAVPNTIGTILTPDQQAFVKGKVEKLGNLEAVQAQYTDPEAAVDQYAIKLAEQVYGKPANVPSAQAVTVPPVMAAPDLNTQGVTTDDVSTVQQEGSEGQAQMPNLRDEDVKEGGVVDAQKVLNSDAAGDIRGGTISGGALPKKPAPPRNLLTDIKKQGGINLASIINALDKNEVRGAKGKGNRYLRVTGKNGVGIDQMAQQMFDAGYPVPMDVNGNVNADGFAQMLKSAINGELPVHADDAERMGELKLAEEIARIEEESLPIEAEVKELSDDDLGDIIDEAFTDDAVANALSFFDQFIEGDQNHEIDTSTNSSTVEPDAGTENQSTQSSGIQERTEPQASGETKPLTEVVSSSGEQQNKLFATPPTFGTKPQTGGKAASTGDLLDSFTVDRTPDLFNSATSVPSTTSEKTKIDDFGEKIGGARKDISTSTGTKSTKAKSNIPAWRRRYIAMENVKTGQWNIIDTETGRALVRTNFATLAEADDILPVAVVGVKHRVNPDGDNFKIIRNVTDRKRVTIKDGFTSRDEAMQYMAEHAQDIIETNTTFGEEILAKPEKVFRTGAVRRDSDATAKMLTDAFGFRAVEFGNWNNQVERQEVMNHAYDGLLDLAEILNIPAQAISLNGELALAFGARGQGLSGAKAHYEPAYAVINLTKLSGAGSLAHEWFHALDNYFARQDGKAKSDKVQNKRGDRVYPAEGGGKDMASSGFKYANSGVREEVRTAFKQLIETMYFKAEQYVEDTEKAENFVGAAARSLEGKLREIRDYMSKNREYGSKKAAATPEQLSRFDELAAKLTTGEDITVEWRYGIDSKPGVKAASRGAMGTNRWTNDTIEVLSKLYKEVTGRGGFNAERRGSMDALVAHVKDFAKRTKLMEEAANKDVKVKKVPTSYRMESYKIDQGRVSDYWTVEHEMASRAFSAYIEDKVSELGNRSDFLSYGSDNNLPWYRMFNVRPFPEGKEREALDKEFDTFFSTLQVKDGNKLFEAGELYGILDSSHVISGKVEDNSNAQLSLFTPAKPVPEKQSGSVTVSADRGQSGVEWYANSTLPPNVRNINADVRLAKVGTFTSGIDQVKTAFDAATFFSPLANEAKEHLMALVLDKDGKPLSLVNVSLGTKNESLASPQNLIGPVLDIPNAATIWFAHNHPTGDLTFSPADHAVNDRSDELVRGTSIKVAGSMVIGEGGEFLASTGDTGKPASGKSSDIPILDQRINFRPSQGAERITAPDQIGKMLAAIGFEGKTGVLLLDNKNRLVATVEIPFDKMGALRSNAPEHSHDLLMRLMSRTNAAAMVIVSDQPSYASEPVVKNMVTFGKMYGVSVLDAITTDGSLAEKNLMPAATGTFFSKANRPVNGISQTKVNAAVDPLLKSWKNAPPIKVVQSEKDLPAGIIDQIQSIGAEGHVRGVFEDGQVYLISDNLHSANEAMEVLLHETVGHYGIRGLLGKQFDAILQQVITVYGQKGLKDIANRYGLDLKDPEDRKIAAEEKLAEMAESGEKPGFIKRVIAMIKDWMRKMGLNLKWTDADIKALIGKARGWVERGKSTDPTVYDGERFMVAKDITKTNEFKKWFGDSKVVDSKGKPLVVYHGTGEDFSVFRKRIFDGPMFFSTSPEFASDFAGTVGLPGHIDINVPKKEGKPNVMPVYLKIGKLFDPSDTEAVKAIVEMLPADSYTTEAKADLESKILAGEWKAIETLDVTDAIKAAGYDGMIVYETLNGETPEKNFAVFEPNQIKSATGNNGQFDGNNPDIRMSLRRTRTGDPAVDAVLDKIGAKDKTMLERIKESLGNLAHKETRMRELEQGIFDKYASLRYLDKMAGVTSPDDSAYIAARMSTSLSDVMLAMLKHGHPVWKDGGSAVQGKGLVQIFKPVAEDLDQFLGWMVGERAQKLMNEGRERYFDQDEINLLKGLKTPANSARWTVARREYVQYKRHVLDFAEESGVINPDARKIWDHEEYVPFYRIVEDKPKGPFKTKGLASQNSGIKTLKGADERLGDIFENIVRNFTHLVDASIKNHSTELSIQKAEAIGAASKAPLEWKSVKINNQDLVDAVHEYFGETQEEVDAFVDPEDMEAFTTFFHPAKPQGKDIIHVLRNGKPEYYQIHDDLLLRSLASINDQVWGGPAMTAMRFVKRLLTMGITSAPDFMIRNFVRDTLHTWTISRGDFTPLVSSLKGSVKAFRDDPDMVQLMAAGGAFHGGYAYGNDPAAAKLMVEKLLSNKGIDKNTLLDSPKKLWEFWQEIGGAMENAARVQTYKNVKDKTGSHLQGAFEAKDIMDFSMRGDWAAINFLTQTVPFFGARLQGLQRLGKGMLENPRAFTFKGALIAFAAVLLYLYNRNNPKYQELEEWDKDTYFHFFVGGKHFRLPKPFEVGAIFGTIPERLTEMAMEKQHDGKLFAQRLASMFTQTFAVGLPQIINEPAQQWANKDFFTDRAIVSPQADGLLPGEQHGAHTSATMQEIGKRINISPSRLDHAVKGYFGTLGTYVLGASDLMTRRLMDYPNQPTTKPEEWPVLSSFYKGDGPARNTKFTTSFYELLKEVDKTAKTVDHLRQTGENIRADKLNEKEQPKLASKPKMHLAQKQLSQINKQVKVTQLDRTMSPDEKRAKLDELQTEKNRITRLVVEQAKENGAR